MKSYALLRIEQPLLWLRFGRVGEYDRFNALLSEFQQAFPFATWDRQQKAWLLSTEDLGKVLNFCKEQKLSPILTHPNNTTNKKRGQRKLPFG